MAKDRKKLQHIHSSIADKQPTPASLEVAEIAVNNAADHEFLSIKNTNNKVVRFSSDGQMIDWVELKEVIPYSGVVDNINLETGRSNIEIKLNQAVADNTKFHNIVNGARDIDGNLVNPTTDGGLTNGAGFAIDMSAYVLSGGNPSFSSITADDVITDDLSATCHTVLEGTTEIKGSSGDCGSLLKIDVNSATTNVISATTIIGDASTTVSGTNTVIVNGLDKETYNRNRIVDVTYDDFLNVLGDRIEHITGDTSQYADNILISSGSRTNINSDGNICIKSNSEADFYGSETTKVGVSCGDEISKRSEVHGEDVVLNATTNNLGITAKNDIIESSESNIIITANDDLCATAGDKASLYGVEQTNVGLNCDDSSKSLVTNVMGTSVALSGRSVDVNASSAFTVDSCYKVEVKTVDFVINDCQSGHGTLTINEPFVTTNADTVSIFSDSTTIDSDFLNLNGDNTYINGNNFSVETCNGITLATDKLTISGCNGDAAVSISGDVTVSGDTFISGDTNISGDTTIGGSLIIPNGLQRKLSWTYGTVSANTGCAQDGLTNFSGTTSDSDKCFVIPRCVGDMQRQTLSISYESVNGLSTDTYDPGVCSGTKTIKVPNSIQHLNEWNNGCFTIDNSLCVTGNITATGSVFSTSDERKKENIKFVSKDEKLKVRNIPIKSFSLKEDNTKRKLYGIIAQEVEAAGLDELVHTDEEGMKSVDYTSFLILRIAYLEDMIGHMHHKIWQLENKINENK